MRQFKLINSIGAEYDLMNTDHFLHKPDGLGYKKDIEFVRVGTSFKAVENDSVQLPITGELIFKDYTEYSTFQAFIFYSPIKFAYKPINTWYYKDGYVSVIDKSEIDRASSRLICDMDFIPTSLWYLPATTHQLIPTDSEMSKIYPFTYDYKYFESKGGQIPLVNSGRTEASCEIGIYGPLTNPYWKLVVNNVIIRDGKLNTTIADGSILVISSKSTEYSIVRRLIGSSSGTNLMTYSDLSTERFIKIPIGTSTMLVGDDTGVAIEAYVKVYQEYESV